MTDDGNDEKETTASTELPDDIDDPEGVELSKGKEEGDEEET